MLFHLFRLTPVFWYYIPMYYSSNVSSYRSFSQYWRPLLNSSISLTVSPISLFFFQFLYWHVFYFSNFHPACFSASPFEIFIVSFQYSSLYYSRTRSIFRLPIICFQVFSFPCGVFDSFSLSFPSVWGAIFEMRLGTSIGRQFSIVLALPVCCRFPLLST